MCRAANNRHKPSVSPFNIRSELNRDGGGAGEGAGDGGAEGHKITKIITIPSRAAYVAVGGGSVIDLHPIIARTTRTTPSTTSTTPSIKTVEGEGDCLSIG